MSASTLLNHKLDYAKIFISSVASVFFAETGVLLKRRSVNVRNTSRPTFQVVTIVAFVADFF